MIVADLIARTRKALRREMNEMNARISMFSDAELGADGKLETIEVLRQCLEALQDYQEEV